MASERRPERRKRIDPRRGLPVSAQMAIEEELRTKISARLAKPSRLLHRAKEQFISALAAREANPRNVSDFGQTKAEFQIAKKRLALLRAERQLLIDQLAVRAQYPYLFPGSNKPLQDRSKELVAEIAKQDREAATRRNAAEGNNHLWNMSWHMLKTTVHSEERTQIERAVQQAQKDRTRPATELDRMSRAMAAQVLQKRLSIIEARKKIVPFNIRFLEEELVLVRSELQALHFWHLMARKQFFPKTFMKELEFRVETKAGQLFAIIKIRDQLRAELEEQGKD